MTSAETTTPAPPTWAPPTTDPPAPPRPRSGPVGAPVAAALAILGGFAIGIVTQVLQGELRGSWNVLANSGVMWSLAAAAVGMLMPTARAAVLGGATSMVVASISYYWAVDWFEGVASNGRSSLIWASVGIVAGGAFGFAGRMIRFEPGRRWLASAVVAGLLLGEGRHLLRFVDWYRPAGLVQVGLGIALAVACLCRDRRPLLVLALVAGGTICHGVALRLVEVAFTLPR